MKKFILACAIIASSLSNLTYADCFNGGDDNFIERCAEKIIGDLIYLKPGCVCISQKDIFIKIDEVIFPLDAVYCDKEGIYIYADQLASLTQCGSCERYYDPEKQRTICPHRFK